MIPADFIDKPVLQLATQGNCSKTESANPHSNSGGHFRIIKKDDNLNDVGRTIFSRLSKALRKSK